MPLVVMGDFNSDPRDPRTPGDNPGGQPEATGDCPAQSGTDGTVQRLLDDGRTPGTPTPARTRPTPLNLSWGASGLLAGPDLERLAAAKRWATRTA